MKIKLLYFGLLLISSCDNRNAASTQKTTTIQPPIVIDSFPLGDWTCSNDSVMFYSCGFEFKRDKTFIFKDRCCLFTGYSEGTWTYENGLVVINSYKKFKIDDNLFKSKTSNVNFKSTQISEDSARTNVKMSNEAQDILSDTLDEGHKNKMISKADTIQKYSWKYPSTYTGSGTYIESKSKKIYKFPYSDTSYEYFKNKKFRRHNDSLIELTSDMKAEKIKLRRNFSNR